MSITQLFAIHDAKAGIFLTPILTGKNQMVAVRDFTNALVQGKTMFSTNPEDFSIWHIGDLHTETGEIFSAGLPNKIADATELLEEVNKHMQSQLNLLDDRPAS